MSRELIVITCPKCGREYLPAEIYIPKEFFGAPDIIQRDTEGKVVDTSGTDMCLVDTYCCDSCSATFNVKADITFTTELDDENDFSSDYVSKINKRFVKMTF